MGVGLQIQSYLGFYLSKSTIKEIYTHNEMSLCSM